MQVFYFFLKEDIFFPRLNSVTIYANHSTWFFFLSSNIAKFEEGKMKKRYWNYKKVVLELGQKEENQNQLHSVSLSNTELEFNPFILTFIGLEQS